MAEWLGDRTGGLLNATLGNATEVIIMIVALQKGLVGVAQATLVGGVISNLLFVIGSAFLVGGGRSAAKPEPQRFDAVAANGDVSVLFIAVLFIILPTVFSSSGGVAVPASVLAYDSHITAVLLLVMYSVYLYFVLSQPLKTERVGPPDEASALYEADEPEDAPPQRRLMSGPLILLLMAVAVFLVTILGNVVMSNIFAMSTDLGLNAAFVAVCVLPFVGNIAELASATLAAHHDHLDLSLSIGLGSATQITLFILPLGVVLGWAMGVPFSLDFEPQLAVAFFGAVLAVALLVSDGEGNWMKGALLLVAFAVISALVVFMQDPSIGKVGGNGFGAAVGAPPVPLSGGGALASPSATS